jgi:hypothetical protein
MDPPPKDLYGRVNRHGKRVDGDESYWNWTSECYVKTGEGGLTAKLSELQKQEEKSGAQVAQVLYDPRILGSTQVPRLPSPYSVSLLGARSGRARGNGWAPAFPELRPEQTDFTVRMDGETWAGIHGASKSLSSTQAFEASPPNPTVGQVDDPSTRQSAQAAHYWPNRKVPTRTRGEALLLEKHPVLKVLQSPTDMHLTSTDFACQWAAQTAAADYLAGELKVANQLNGSAKIVDAELSRPRPLVPKPPAIRHETLTPRSGIGCGTMNAHHALTNPKWRAQLRNTHMPPQMPARKISTLTPYGSFAVSSQVDLHYLHRLSTSSRIGSGSPWNGAPVNQSRWPQSVGGGFKQIYTQRESPRDLPQLEGPIVPGTRLTLSQR